MRTVLLLVLAALPAAAQGLEVVGRYDSGLKQGTEIISIQATTKRAVLTLGARGVQLLDLADPAKPKLLRALPWGGAEGSQVTSAAFHPTRDLVAVAYRLQDRKERGGFALIRPGQGLLTYMTRAGYDPDHIAFDPTGRYLVIANEAEHHWVEGDAVVSQPGSVTIVECDGDPTKVSEVVLPPADARGMTTAAHGRFLERGIHLVPLTGGDPRQLEPESLAFSPDGTRCYVTLQENNLVAEFDLKAPGLLRYIGLGHTRHAADRTDDGKVSFTEELFAGREPDGIAVTPDGRYLVTADEGDTAPKASKTPKEKPAGGGRTVTVLDARTGAVLGDTGNGLDQAAHRAGVYPDARSDSRGSEPENLVVFEAAGKTWAAVGLERANAVALVDLGDPRRPVVVGACPLGGRSRSPEGIAVLVVDGTVYLYSANEGSGDVTVLRFKP